MSDQDWADKLYRAIFANIEAGNEDACVSMLIGALRAARDSAIEDAIMNITLIMGCAGKDAMCSECRVMQTCIDRIRHLKSEEST